MPRAVSHVCPDCGQLVEGKDSQGRDKWPLHLIKHGRLVSNPHASSVVRDDDAEEVGAGA